ncbi:MAG TPA: VWA domain-containing protein [Kofleriaceae bacterium]
MVFLAACGTQNSSDGAGDPGNGASGSGSAGGGGGGVSFGGAQDIGDFRAILDRGAVPGPDTLDANGFFNEHYNAPAPASCGNVLCAAAGLTVGRDWQTGAHQAVLQIAVDTTVDPATYQRLPMNLVVVVDHSGSMAQDNRIDKVKTGLNALIDHLHDDDHLAIVEFDDQVKVDAALGSALNRPALHTIVSKIQPDGGTDIYDGLQQGFALLGDAPADRQNRVIFLSDGLATVGNTDSAAIRAMAAKAVAKGIGLTTIGVGEDFDIQLMRGLAEQGAGNFYFLEDSAAATEVFTEEVDYFLQPIAVDIDLALTGGPGYTLGEAAGTTLWTNGATSGHMLIPAAFVASRTTQSSELGRRGGGSMIFVPLTYAGGSTGKVASITLSYRLPRGTERITQTIALDYAADPSDTPAQPYLSAPEMAERYAMYNVYRGLYQATHTSAGCAIAALQATRTSAATWNASHEDPDLADDLTLIDQFLANLSAVGGYEIYQGGYAPTCGTDPGTLMPYPVDGEPPTDNVNYIQGCSTGGPTGGLVVMLGAVAALARRRRR